MKFVAQKNMGEVLRALKQGKIIAVPTETVYGLAVRADNMKAIDKLLTLKNRNGHSNKVLTMMVADVDDIRQFANMTRKMENLSRHFLPGELTVVMPKKKGFRHDYFDYFESIGFRIPKHRYMLGLLKKSGPLLVTSANLKGEAPCMNSREVKKRVPGIDVIVNGKAHGNLPSTVVDLSHDEPIVRRQGGLLIVRY